MSAPLSNSSGHEYRVTAILADEQRNRLIAIDTRVSVDKGLDWVKKNVDELAAIGVREAPISQAQKQLPIVALNIKDLSQ